MNRRIDKRPGFAGTGMLNSPERIEELELRRAQHDRLTRGKPAKAFGEILEEKMRAKRKQEKRDEEEEDRPEKGAIDPHLGLSPGQSVEVAKGGKGRRAGKVIVKG